MESYTERIERFFKSFSRYGCILGGWLLILISLIICTEVVLRKVFHLSLQGIDEYGGYSLALTSALGLAYAFYEGTHIKIDIIIRLLPRPLRLCSGLLALSTFFGVALFFALKTVSYTIDSWDLGAFANTPLRTPLYIPQSIWAAGFCLFAIVLGVRLLLITETAIRKQKSELAGLLGTDQDKTGIESVISEVSKKKQNDEKDEFDQRELK